MNKFLRYLKGYWVITFAGPSPQQTLNVLTEYGIPFWATVWKDAFTVSICVAKPRRNSVKSLIRQCMCDIVSERFQGMVNDFGGVFRRPVLLISLLTSVLIMLVVPQYVLFFHVVGNETVPTEQIIWALDEIGVGFGTPGVEIKPQWIKNRMLNMIPDLEWITVTQNGCRAQVVVRERTHRPETENRKGAADVIALQSGQITKKMVFAGQALCEVGDIVAKGDLLVSGLVDLERTYSVVKADAEIYAKTWRRSEAISPKNTMIKQWTGETSRTYWFSLGKKRIKLFGKSGISSGVYDKIITTKNLVLPGGLALPCSVTVETKRKYVPVEAEVGQEQVRQFLQQMVRQNVQGDMIAGEILQESYDMTTSSGTYRMTAELECHEMIASVIDAEWYQEDYFHDREVRQRGENGTDH